MPEQPSGSQKPGERPSVEPSARSISSSRADAGALCVWAERQAIARQRQACVCANMRAREFAQCAHAQRLARARAENKCALAHLAERDTVAGTKAEAEPRSARARMIFDMLDVRKMRALNWDWSEGYASICGSLKICGPEISSRWAPAGRLVRQGKESGVLSTNAHAKRPRRCASVVIMPRVFKARVAIDERAQRPPVTVPTGP